MYSLRNFRFICFLFIAVALLNSLSSPVRADDPNDEAGCCRIFLPLLIKAPEPANSPGIIKGVLLEKNQVCLGEDFRVTVQVEQPQGAIDIAINGQWGNPQYLQFRGLPGKRWIDISASTPTGQLDNELVEIEIIECGQEQPLVYTRPNPYHDLIVDFEVANVQELDLERPVYTWEFGDGERLVSDAPFVSHNYRDSLAPDRPYTVFQASLQIDQAGRAALSVRKTVTIWNLYYLNKQRGFIQPSVETSGWLKANGASLIGDYSITNLESEPISIIATKLEYQYCNPARDPAVLPLENWLSELGSQQKIEGQLILASKDVPADVCGLTYHFAGKTLHNLETYFSLYFEVEREALITPVTEADRLALLNWLAEQGLVDDPDLITEEDLYRLEQEGRLTSWNARAGNSLSPLEVIGEVCEEGQQPPRAGVSCQATQEWTVRPAHIANAKKGDVILSAGCGLVGEMLRKVWPPQKYTHSGLMTKNYYEIRHSTASTERYKSYPVGYDPITGEPAPTDGFRPDVIKYGWPGVITQTVSQAYTSQMLVDPESKKTYRVEGFNADPALCDQDMGVVSPIVVKPPPQLEQERRSSLHAAAEAALLSGHYRFFNYSRGDTSQHPGYNGPASTGWAAGAPATVCSSFIWDAFKRAEIELEGHQLEAGDVGAETDAETADGLYLYTEVERQIAGQALYRRVYNMVYEAAGDWGRLLTDAPDDTANQITNCFASDWCETEAKDSERWKNPGLGRSVSPDNILFWDVWAAPAEGIYGYNEPLIYRTGRYQRVYRWQPTEGTGTVTGQVFYQGKPVAHAEVAIRSLGLSQPASANGGFTFLGVPAGQYTIEASKIINNALYTSPETSVRVTAGATRTVNLTLKPPPHWYRQVTIQGDLFIRDADWPDSDDTGSFTFLETTRLNSEQRQATLTITRCVDEVKVEVVFHLQLETDNTTVTVSSQAKMYEDDGIIIIDPTDCDHGDNVDTEILQLALPEDESSAGRIELRDDGDEGNIDFIIANIRQP